MLLPAWSACTTTVPLTPVSVMVEPETVAGPERIVSVGPRPDEAEVVTVNGGDPVDLSSSAGKVIVWFNFTMNVCVTGLAGLKVELPAWDATTVTLVPPFVSVSVEPEMVAGPEVTV